MIGGNEVRCPSGETEIECSACGRLVAIVSLLGEVEVRAADVIADLTDGTVALDCPARVRDAIAGTRPCENMIEITRADCDRLRRW